jgi:hypothetical protein
VSVCPRRELVIGAATYGAYLLVRRLVWNDRGRARARRNGGRLLALERRLGLDVEARLQQRLLVRRRLVHGLNVGYAAFNVTVTVCWLVRLLRRRDPAYVPLRRACLLAYLGAQPVFLAFPTAPPRSLPGGVDTLSAVSRLDLEHPLLLRLYNPIAALPSLHCAFAAITGASLAERGAGPLALAYPPAVAFVVVATGNHYVLDTVAGAALGLAARRLAA